MSEPIKVGDLVMVVQPTTCCGNGGRVGSVHTVTDFFNDGYVCGYCRKTYGGILVALVDGVWGGYEVSRLKRIPPLSELDDVNKAEEIHA